jgi:CRP-like cAMP-binding protein
MAGIEEGKTMTICEAGEIIFREGDPADTVFYLQRGHVKETVTSEQGKETTVGVLEPGQFFGTSGLNGATVRVSSTRAMTKSTMIAVTNVAMRCALENEPNFSLMFVGWLLRHSSRIEAEKFNLQFNKSEKRLAQMLLLLARAGDGAPRTISTTIITQGMLADMISASRPYVNRAMRKFRKLGLIEYSEGIRVNPSRLAAVLKDKVRRP